MRLETWLARLVFALGAFVMIATSAPPRWGDSENLEAELQSEGQGDDKLVRIRVRLTGGVAADAQNVEVRLAGAVDRPASDLTIDWLGANVATPGQEGPQAFSTSDDFLTVYSDTDRWRSSLEGAGGDERLFEARIATASSEAYAMTLAITVSVRGTKKKRPSGEIEASVEVLDAP